MKSVIKILGIVALAAAIVFAITACGDSGSGDGKGGNGTLPPAGDGSISFASAKEYPVYDYFDPNTSYPDYDITFIAAEKHDGSVLDFSGLVDWDVKIDGTTGTLSLKLGTPPAGDLISPSALGLNATSGLQAMLIGEFYPSVIGWSGKVEWKDVNSGKEVLFIYADRVGSISGTFYDAGKGESYSGNMSLKQGWNTAIVVPNGNTFAYVTGVPSGSNYKWLFY